MTGGDLPGLGVGDHVRDRDDPDATMVVVGLPLQRAATYEIDDGETVADYNAGYPETDHVIEVVYPQRTDVSLDELREYAFPRSRLERVAAVHEAESGPDA